MVNVKAWYASKTIWVSIVFIAAGILQSITGQTISPAEQITIIGFIALILRLVTNNAIDLGGNGTSTPLS